MLESVYVKKPVYGNVGNRKIIKNFGNINEEYNALRNGAMLYDCCGYGIYFVSGSEASDFLDKLATKEIQYLNVGNISECYFLNERAEVIASVFILRQEKNYMVITPWEHAEGTKKWILDKSRNYSQVNIQCMDGQFTAFSIEGPYSWKLVKNVLNIDVGSLPLRVATDVEIDGEIIQVMRIGRTGEYGYFILGSQHACSFVYEKMLREGEKLEYPFCEGGLDVIEMAILEIHQPNFLREKNEIGNIIELEQQWHIQYDKSEYIGYKKLQEIFENGVQRHSVGFMCQGDFSDLAGEKVYIGDEKIGHVIYSIFSLKLEKHIGILLLNNPYAHSGLIYKIRKNSGEEIEINTISSPFVRPLSWDLKME